MIYCVCNKYLQPIDTFEELRERCAVSSEILPFLKEVAVNVQKWMSVYRCQVCGTLWAKEYPFGESHGGGPPYLYIIETENPEEWLRNSKGFISGIRQTYEYRQFFESLGAEIGPELCRYEGCERKRIAYGVMCRCHHFEMVMRRPCPF